MCMPNARILHLELNTTYIPLTRVGVLCWVMQKFASPNAKDTNMLVSFALGDASLVSFVLGDPKVPNANFFFEAEKYRLKSLLRVPFRTRDLILGRRCTPDKPMMLSGHPLSQLLLGGAAVSSHCYRLRVGSSST